MRNSVLDLKIICEDEKYMPSYANEFDACMDLRVKIPAGVATIFPGQKKIFGTGLKVAVPRGYAMFVFARSSTGVMLHCLLSNSVGVIDSGYKGEIHLDLYNFGDKPIELIDGQRVAQFLLAPRPKINLIPEIDSDDFYKNDRGGGLGSSGCF